VGSLLNWEYFPAQAYIDPVQRFYKIFVALFLSIAALEIIRLFRTQWHRQSYLGAQAFVDLVLGSLIVLTFIAGTIEIKSSQTVMLGNQKFQFSTLDYPIANERFGAEPLFRLEEDDLVQSVYLGSRADYDFEKAFADTYARKFHIAIHAPNSPNLNEFQIQPRDITLDKGSVLIDEGEFVLELFPSSGGNKETNLRFLKFVKENISKIRADIETYKVAALR